MTDSTDESVALTAAWKAAFALMGQGAWTSADIAFQKLLAVYPQAHLAWLQRARCAVARSELVTARTHFLRLLVMDRSEFSGWLELGNLERRESRLESAVQCYRQAAYYRPTRFEAHLSLARVLEELGHPEAAAAAYQTALEVSEPQGHPDLHWRMAQFRRERGHLAPALESLRQAQLAARLEGDTPDSTRYCEMQLDLGDILMRMGVIPSAHRAFEVASTSEDESTLARLAEVSFRHNLWQEAQQVCEKATMLFPESSKAWWNLAYAYSESWDLQKAEEALEKAETLGEQSGAASMRAALAGRRGDVDESLRLYVALAEKDAGFASSAVMSALYSDRMTAEEVASLHQHLFSSLGRTARSPESFGRNPNPDRRLRLGILTADMHHQHPVNIFMQPVLARLDKSLFETVIYDNGIAFDSQTQQARARVDHWLHVKGWPDSQLAQRIDRDRIDLMLDLSGHTTHHRLGLLSQRVAPVQITFLGYPHSTGVPNIDWMLGDPMVMPKGCEALFSERIYRLPQTVFCYAPEADYPYPEYGQQHLNRPLTFGSFNNLPKLTPRTLGLWAQVLKAIPESRLLLKAPSFRDPSAQKALADRLEKFGIDRSRVEFRGPVGLADMMAEYADVDIALDPVPYNGGTTTLQALWMGVPVIVMAGDNFVSRMGASFMTAAGLSDWVADSDEAYIEIARSQSKDRDALLTLKQGLRKHLQSQPAWDIERYVDDLSAALKFIWREHCEKPFSGFQDQ